VPHGDPVVWRRLHRRRHHHCCRHHRFGPVRTQRHHHRRRCPPHSPAFPPPPAVLTCGASAAPTQTHEQPPLATPLARAVATLGFRRGHWPEPAPAARARRRTAVGGVTHATQRAVRVEKVGALVPCGCRGTPKAQRGQIDNEMQGRQRNTQSSVIHRHNEPPFPHTATRVQHLPQPPRKRTGQWLRLASCPILAACQSAPAPWPQAVPLLPGVWRATR